MLGESAKLSKVTNRMQVLFDNGGYRHVWRMARACRTTVAQWVRPSQREARMPRRSAMAAKLRAVDEAARHSFPVGDIDAMLREIEANRLPA